MGPGQAKEYGLIDEIFDPKKKRRRAAPKVAMAWAGSRRDGV